MSQKACLHAVVYGVVQGVNFRSFVLRYARDLGLTGYVRNLYPGGTVEVEAEGQREQLERFKKLEDRRIPDAVDYDAMSTLSKEAREKLSRIKPLSLGQAARISGVSPADIAILSLMLAKQSSGGSVPRGTN